MASYVLCGTCGSDAVSDGLEVPESGRAPCPVCGSTPRHVSADVTDNIGLTEYPTSGSATVKLSAAAAAVLVQAPAGEVNIPPVEPQPEMAVGQVDHVATLTGTTLQDDLILVQVLDRVGNPVCAAVGKDWVEALYDLIFSLLPSDHPGFLGEPRER